MRLLLQALLLVVLAGAFVLLALTAIHLAGDVLEHGFVPTTPQGRARRNELTIRAAAGLALVAGAWILVYALNR